VKTGKVIPVYWDSGFDGRDFFVPDSAKGAPVAPFHEFYETVKTKRDLPPVYHFPESAARALFMLARYAAWHRRPSGSLCARWGARPRC